MPFVNFLVERGWEVPFFAWGGAAFDLLIVPALLWRRTRYWAFVVAVTFHLLNDRLFSIGVFPWMMIALTTIFLAPDWPRRLLRRIPRVRTTAFVPATDAGVPAVTRLAFTCLVAYVSFQCLWPARAVLYPGNVLWTEEAQTFSWRMMLREKRGDVILRVESARAVDTVPLPRLLRPWQVQAVATRPFLTLQLAHFLANYYREQGRENVRVYADAWISLNGRAPQRLIDPDVDLASQRRSLLPAKWILPLVAAAQARGVTNSGGPVRR